jgi:hypothetical protein
VTQFDLATHRNRIPMAKDGVVYFADDAVALWTNKKLGYAAPLVGYVALGILHPTITDEFANQDAEELVLNLPEWLAAGVFFWGERSDATGHIGESDIYCTVATADGNMTSLAAHPTVIKRILEWPFQIRNLRRISAEIAASNTRAINGFMKLGAKEDGRKREAGKNGEDVIIFGLLRKDCRIWNERDSLKLEEVA